MDIIYLIKVWRVVDHWPDFEKLWQVEDDRPHHDGRHVVLEVLGRQEFRGAKLAEEADLETNAPQACQIFLDAIYQN
jgi:hypothetical protein